MERYRAFLLPGVAALLLLAYYAWRLTSGGAAEPAPAGAAADGKAPASAPAGEARK